jgi:hypothetical protein
MLVVLDNCEHVLQATASLVVALLERCRGVRIRGCPAVHRESDLLAFEIAIERAQPGSVMTGYNKINGEYAGGNSILIQSVLKGAWGYPGWCSAMTHRMLSAPAEPSCQRLRRARLLKSADRLYQRQPGRRMVDTGDMSVFPGRSAPSGVTGRQARERALRTPSGRCRPKYTRCCRLRRNAAPTTVVDTWGRLWTPRYLGGSSGLLRRIAVDSCGPGHSH